MHELSIMQSLVEQLDAIAHQHHADRIARFTIEVGELSNIVPEILVNAFALIKAETPLLAHTLMEVRQIPIILSCNACGRKFSPEMLKFRCDECGSVDVQMLQGEELLLRDVELEIESEGVSNE